MENIYWEGYSSNERYAAMQTIQQVVSSYGDIVDINRFSDLSVVLKIEINPSNILPLFEALCKHIGMDKNNHIYTPSEKERTIFLNITFSQGKGNLNVPVPAVPG
jgi:hypothetical protein